jgi:hypothetical protein
MIRWVNTHRIFLRNKSKIEDAKKEAAPAPFNVLLLTLKSNYENNEFMKSIKIYTS